LILVSSALLASFVIPDFSLVNPFRVVKIMALLATGLFGFYGMILVLSLVLIRLVSLESFGVPYFSPLTPFNWYDFVRAMMFNISFSPMRHKYLRDRDKKRKKG
jgi:spore germination protein KA/spore germination protein